MKKGKLRKLLSFMLGIMMLFSCMLVSAAEKPTLADNLTDNDEGWAALDDYMSSLDTESLVLIDTAAEDCINNTSDAAPYFETGKLIATKQDWDAVSDGWAAENFTEQYNLIKALDASVVSADGSKHISDQMHANLDDAWNRLTTLDSMLGNLEVVIQVEDESAAPDVSEMSQGTYWILVSDLEAHWATEESLVDEETEWKDGDNWKMVSVALDDCILKLPDLEASSFNAHIASINDACDTLLSKLHEGTQGTSTSTPGTTPTQTSVSTSTSSVPTLTEEGIHTQKAAEAEARQKKVVTTVTGETVKTEIAGVYEVNNLNGTAVNTPKAEVQKAIGLTEEEIVAGTNVSTYMSDFVEKEDREALNNAATNSGKKVLSMLVSDMYSITKDGKITKLHSSKEPVSLIFGLPKHAIDANRVYAVLCVTADGKVVELKDKDNDPSTLTVDTTVFGKYVIVY